MHKWNYLFQGVSQLADLRVDSHTSYEHSTSVDEFQDAMSAVLEEELLQKIRQSGKFSIMFDESTDISVHQNLIMYIKILEKNNIDIVEPHTYFLSIDSLYRANADAIYCNVRDTLLRKGKRPGLSQTLQVY